MENETKLTAETKTLNIADVSSSYIGKECFWVDKVTHKKHTMIENQVN